MRNILKKPTISWYLFWEGTHCSKVIQNVADFLLVFSVLGIAVVLVSNKMPGLSPFQRGFFCDDQTLMYPYQDDIIQTDILTAACILAPPIMVIICEMFHLQFKKDLVCSTKFFILLCYVIGNYWLGGGLTLVTTEIIKLCAGRFRPHFFDVCQPVIHKGDNCSVTLRGYIAPDAYFCSGTNVEFVQDVRKSFPSSHATVAVYFLVNIVIYLDKRVRLEFQGYFRVLVPILQTACLVCAIYVCISRVQDNHHHVTDIIAGGVIGLLGCLVTMFRLSSKFPKLFLDLKDVEAPTYNADDNVPYAVQHDF